LAIAVKGEGCSHRTTEHNFWCAIARLSSVCGSRM